MRGWTLQRERLRGWWLGRRGRGKNPCPILAGKLLAIGHDQSPAPKVQARNGLGQKVVVDLCTAWLRAWISQISFQRLGLWTWLVARILRRYKTAITNNNSLLGVGGLAKKSGFIGQITVV